MTTSPSRMRIQVGPDGLVEFSVPLNCSTDPSLVANMVAAVRAGIISAPLAKLGPATVQQPPLNITASPSNTPEVSAVTAPPPHNLHGPDFGLPSPSMEPRSDRDGDVVRPDRPPSPLVSQQHRKLSVREIAAQLDAGSNTERRSLHLYSTSPIQDTPSHEVYDSVREFSSSPALWLTGGSGGFDPYGTSSNNKDTSARASISKSGTLPRSQSSRDDETSKHCHSQPQRPHRPRGLPPSSVSSVANMFPDRDLSDKAVEENDPTEIAPAYVTGPIRMLSLPAGSQREEVNNMRFGETGGSGREVASMGSRSNRYETGQLAAVSAATDMIASGQVVDKVPVISPADRIRARRDRTAAMRDHYRPKNELAQRTTVSDLNESSFQNLKSDERMSPTSPFVQHSDRDEDEELDAWDNVEYELTESYRDDRKVPDVQAVNSGRARKPHRSSAWRFLASLGQSLGKRRVEADQDIYQSTLAAGSSMYKSDKTVGEGRGPMRRRGARFGGRSGGLLLEFSAQMDVERLLSELGKVAKTLGFQVWRRPGENKLRCVRWLNQRHEMHMWILASPIAVPQGEVCIVRIKRAKTDRNRTEAWRYSQCYREVIERLQRGGIEVTSEI